MLDCQNNKIGISTIRNFDSVSTGVINLVGNGPYTIQNCIFDLGNELEIPININGNDVLAAGGTGRTEVRIENTTIFVTERQGIRIGQDFKPGGGPPTPIDVTVCCGTTIVGSDSGIWATSIAGQEINLVTDDVMVNGGENGIDLESRNGGVLNVDLTNTMSTGNTNFGINFQLFDDGTIDVNVTDSIFCNNRRQDVNSCTGTMTTLNIVSQSGWSCDMSEEECTTNAVTPVVCDATCPSPSPTVLASTSPSVSFVPSV